MTRTRPQARRQQRWPDVMIGVLTLALLGGFGALLLDQRKPAATATDAAPTQAQATATQPSIPASPGTVAPTDTAAPSTADTASTAATPAQNSAAQTAQTQTTQGQTTPGQSTSAQSNAAQSNTAAATSATPADTTGTATATPSTTDAATASAPTTTSGGVAQTTEIPPVPKAPDVAPITPPTGVTPQQQQANQQQAGSTDTAGTAAGTSVSPRSGGAVATSENRTPLRSDYRISLGSFSTQATVGTQTANVRSLGYTIHSIDLGNQYVAQVGPFADEATARQALADIQRSYPGALLYRPRGAAADSSASDSSSSASTPSSSSGSSAASTSADSDRAGRTSDAAPAPSGPTYLQVGAFDRVDSAQKLVGQLRDAGFAPTVNNPPDRKTTVLVGPYSGDALVRAENRLNTAGLDHFRVR